MNVKVHSTLTFCKLVWQVLIPASFAVLSESNGEKNIENGSIFSDVIIKIQVVCCFSDTVYLNAHITYLTDFGWQ